MVKNKRKELKPVSQEYLNLAWQHRPLASPEKLGQLLAEFDQRAEGILQSPRLEIPSRQQLVEEIVPAVVTLLDEPTVRAIRDWLLESCHSLAQRERIDHTLQQLPHSPYLLAHPVLEFLFHRWAEGLPRASGRWVPLWCGLVREGNWPTPSSNFMQSLSQSMKAEQAPELPEQTPAWDHFLDWWRTSGLLLGWHRSPEDFYERLKDRAYEEWLESHPGFPLLCRPERQSFPATARFETIASLMWADEQLLKLLPNRDLDDFLMNPGGPEWVESLARNLEKKGLTEVASRLRESLKKS